MGKKAQVTFIMAAALFILIIAALIFYVANYYKKNAAEPLIFERASIENYISSCVKKTAEDGLLLLGKHGSLFPENSLKAKNIGIEYYNENKVPGIEKLQNDLSSYIDNNLALCLNDFEDFKKQGWDVEKGSISARTQINQEDVTFEVEFPLKVSSSEASISFERFASRVNIRLKYIHELITKIVGFDAKYKRHIDMSTLDGYDVDVTVIDYEGALIYNIKDSKSMIMGKPYAFRFAVK
ncbi:hypothetical protein HYX08_01510 [Candidatus Woesearchaeota archaeon]|nr:hypothetical protein [Candidatus Woesearchaeota archaeon]